MDHIHIFRLVQSARNQTGKSLVMVPFESNNSENWRVNKDYRPNPLWGTQGVIESARGVITNFTSIFFIKNYINHYFGYQIRILRGRFTPRGFLLEEVF